MLYYEFHIVNLVSHFLTKTFGDRLWPSYASAHNNLGTLLSGAEDAEEHFMAAIRISPGHVNAHYNLGMVYRSAIYFFFWWPRIRYAFHLNQIELCTDSLITNHLFCEFH